MVPWSGRLTELYKIRGKRQVALIKLSRRRADNGKLFSSPELIQVCRRRFWLGFRLIVFSFETMDLYPLPLQNLSFLVNAFKFI